MTTAIIGTGGIGSAIARQLAAGGETLQLSSADKESARKLAAAESTFRTAVKIENGADGLDWLNKGVFVLPRTCPDCPPRTLSPAPGGKAGDSANEEGGASGLGSGLGLDPLSAPPGSSKPMGQVT
jgi:hypothetical protein